MSFEITTAFVQQYGSTIEHLVQQRGSRLRNTVMIDTGVVGKRAYYDQIGKTTAQSPASRHADSPLISTPHARRVIDLIDKEVGDLIDNDDMVRTLINPENEYTQAFAFAIGRAVDAEIIRALTATALTGETGDGTETFTGQDTDGGAAPVVLQDLIDARQALRSREALMDGELVTCVCSSAFISDLLADSAVQSIDTNTVRALVNGEVTSFMGFNFVQTELVDNIGTTDEKAYIYPRSGVKLAIGRDITHRISERPDKRFSTYVYSNMTFGATRMQLEKVQTITIDR